MAVSIAGLTFMGTFESMEKINREIDWPEGNF